MNPVSAIGEVLFTKTQQRVLGILYGQSEKSFYLNELVRLADMGKGTVLRELEKLNSVGLITLTKQGNQNHYQANANNPIFSELKSIVTKTFGVVGILRDALQIILPNIELAFVYGSIAKGEEHADSDIDVMLVGDLSYTEVMNLLLESEAELARKINPTIYSAKEFKSKLKKKQQFIRKVLEQNKLWIHGQNVFEENYLES